MCFLVNIAKFLKTTILKNICERLPLCISYLKLLSLIRLLFWNNHMGIKSYELYIAIVILNDI